MTKLTLPGAAAEIITPRLLLREMAPDDGPQIVSLRNSAHVRASAAEVDGEELSLSRHLEWFATTRERRVDFVIIERASGAIVGGVSADALRCPAALSGLELGKFIGSPKHLGKGFGTEAAAAWVAFLERHARHSFLFSRTRTENMANIRINLRLGFQKNAWPDWLEVPSGSWTYMERRLDLGAADNATRGSD